MVAIQRPTRRSETEWVAPDPLPVTQPVPLDNVLARNYAFVVTPSTLGGWSISFPDLPGCNSHARTWDEVGPMARETSEIWLTSMYERNYPIPEVSDWVPDYQAEGAPNRFSKPVGRIDGLPDPEPEPIYSVERVAGILDLSRRRIQKIAQEHDLGRLVSGVKLFSPSDVDIMRQNRRPVGRPPTGTAARRNGHGSETTEEGHDGHDHR